MMEAQFPGGPNVNFNTQFQELYPGISLVQEGTFTGTVEENQSRYFMVL